MMKPTITFSFYAELNDFLDKDHKHITYAYHFEANSTVKDSIEAQGVPHTEVEWILVNEVSVDFYYRLKDRDVVEVFPASTLRGEPLVVRPPLVNMTFIVDANVRKITKYMRMLGFDTITDEGVPDEEIAILAWEQNRIVLTRDIGLLKRKNVNYGYFVRSEHVEEQVIEVVRRYNLYKAIRPFSLCLSCNGAIKEVKKETILELLPESIRDGYETFFQCHQCQKVYWKGSHFDNMQIILEKLKEGA